MIRFAAAPCAVGAGVGAAASGPPQAKADGCGRAAPWVYVGDASAASVPPPRWVGGPVRAHPSSDDLMLDLPGGDLGSNAAGRLEVRREPVPFFVWPEQGDWVSALGSWVWNCGTRATELHPFRALWVQRPVSARSPAGESEAELYTAPDATAAGLSAECAHTAKADPATFAACISAPRALDVTGGYAFTLPAPLRPRGAGPLRARIVDRGGGPDPTVTGTGNAARVTLHLDAGAVIARQIFLGWSKVPQAALPEHLRVRLRSLVVCSSAGPWSLYWDIAAGLRRLARQR